MQYLDTGWIGELLTLLVVFFILFNVKRAEGRNDLFIRRIPGLNALDDAIGRATEMGRPVLMVPGIGGLDAVAVQAVNIFANVSKKAAQFNTPIGCVVRMRRFIRWRAKRSATCMRRRV